MALTVLSLEPDAAALDVGSWPPTSIRASIAEGRRGVYPAAALGRVPADLRKRYFDRRRRRRAAQLARRRRAAPPGRLPAAQSDRRLADDGQVPRDLLPQRRHLFRRADPADGLEQVRRASSSASGVLYIGHSERVTGAAGGALRSDGVTAYRLKDGSGA